VLTVNLRQFSNVAVCCLCTLGLQYNGTRLPSQRSRGFYSLILCFFETDASFCFFETDASFCLLLESNYIFSLVNYDNK
jgi:hypothetical protein